MFRLPKGKWKIETSVYTNNGLKEIERRWATPEESEYFDTEFWKNSSYKLTFFERLKRAYRAFKNQD